MALPSWKVLISRIDSLEDGAKKKLSVFQGHNSIIESSVKTSFLFLPKPLDKIAEVIYKKYNGTAQDRTKQVIEYFTSLKEKGEQHYNMVKQELDDFLSKLEGTKHDPVISGNENIVETLKEILISDQQKRVELLRTLSDYTES